MLTATSTLAAAAMVAVAVFTGGSAAADEDDVQISAEPVARGDSYFSLTAAPGKTKRLKVALRNNESVPVDVRTYPTDVYSIPNGGMGVGLADDPTTGTATWISYPDEVLTLGAESQRTRGFEVTVPRTAEPGEYIAAIVVENNEPIRKGAREGVQINQVMRHAVAVAIRVPGPLAPQMTIGAATDALVGGRTQVSVAVENNGNQHLTPQADMVLRDLDGQVLAQQSIAMNTVYAGTDASVEMMLSGELPPNSYTVELQLGSPALGGSVQSAPLPLTVSPKVEPVNPKADTGTGGRVAELLNSDTADATLWLRTLGPYLAALALAAAASLLLLLLRRRRRDPAPPGAPGPRMPSHAPPAGWPPPTAAASRPNPASHPAGHPRAPAPPYPNPPAGHTHLVGAGGQGPPPPSGPPTRPA